MDGMTAASNGGRDAAGRSPAGQGGPVGPGRRGVPAPETAGGLTRRAVLGGVAAIPLVGIVPAMAGQRVGWPDGLGLDGEVRWGACRVRLPSVGALRDHLAAGLVDAALLPLSTPGVAFPAPALSLPPAEAWLLLGPGGGRGGPGGRDGGASEGAPVLARPAADRDADVALLALWREIDAGGAPELLALAPGQALANVAAGRLAAALLFGPGPAVPAGCRPVALGRRATLRPALGLAFAASAASTTSTAFADA